MIGLVVVAIGMSFGGMHGYAINPARDFGPRLFTVFAGFRNNGMTDGTHVWWIPVVAPLLGGLLAPPSTTSASGVSCDRPRPGRREVTCTVLFVAPMRSDRDVASYVSTEFT